MLGTFFGAARSFKSIALQGVKAWVFIQSAAVVLRLGLIHPRRGSISFFVLLGTEKGWAKKIVRTDPSGKVVDFSSN